MQLPLWKVDFWALGNTWAHKKKHVKVSTFQDLLKCSFFTSDAIAYKISDRSIIADDRYLNDIWTKTLEVNLLPNPSIEGNMVRAIRRLLSNDLRAGPVLRKFISDNLTTRMFLKIITIEKELYGYSHAEQYDDHYHLLDAVLYKNIRNVIAHGVGAQYELPFAHLGRQSEMLRPLNFLVPMSRKRQR